MITVVLTARDRDGNVVATHNLPENTESIVVSCDMDFVLAQDRCDNLVGSYSIPKETDSVVWLREVTYDPPLKYTAGKCTFFNTYATSGVRHVL